MRYIQSDLECMYNPHTHTHAHPYAQGKKKGNIYKTSRYINPPNPKNDPITPSPPPSH